MADAFEDVAGAQPIGMGAGVWIRRALMTLLAVVPVLALLNTFGQRPSTSAAAGPVASMTVLAPARVRGGIFFEGRIDVVARRSIVRPRIVLAEGWLEGMQVNSIEPQPSSENSRAGRLVLSWNQLEVGDHLRVWLQFEVNPTNVGRRDLAVEFDDGADPLARIERDITVLP